MAPIFGRGEYTPTVAERCECGAMFIFARDPREAIAGLGRRREGRRRPMSVEKTNVEIDGFTGYAVKRVIVIKKSEMTVARKYRAEFIRIVIPSEIPVREGVYAVYHDGDDLILRRVGEGLPPPPGEAPTTPEQGIVVEGGVAEARGEELETEKVDGTPLKVSRDIPESVREEAKEALEELPPWDREAVNSITAGESSPIYGAGGQYLPSAKGAKVYREGIAHGETKETPQHEVGHGVFFNTPPEKQRELFEALNEAHRG
jgi:hypothetical protein